MNRLLLVAFAALLVLAPCAAAQTLHAFGAALTGANENPPVASDGSGYAYLVFIDNPGATPDSFVVAGSFDHLEGTYNASHLHKAPAGTNGPIVQGLTASTDLDNQGGSWDAGANRYQAPAGFLADLQAGDIYANVHTSFAGSGELRAQLSAAPLIDGDLSDADYLSLATKQNANAGFGSAIDATEIVYFADKDAEVLYLGVKGKLNQFSGDAIGLWLNFDDPAGAPAGTELGKVPGAAFNYFDAADSAFVADFEVDYAFSINPGGTSTDAFFDGVTYVDSTRSDFLGTADQSGTTIFGPADGTSNTGGPVFFTSVAFAFDNAGSGNTGLEFAIPFADLGIDAANPGKIQAFAFVVSSTAYFSDVSVPGDITAGNLGFNPDFNANMTDANCSCGSPNSTIGTGPFNAMAQLCPVSGGPITIDANPEAQAVAQGGMAAFEYLVTNNTAATQSGVVFYEVFLPNGNRVVGPVQVRSGSIGPNSSTPTLAFSVNVPANASTLTYRVDISVGLSNGNAAATDEVLVTVTAPSGIAAGSGSWDLASADPWPALEASARTAAVTAYPNPFAGATTIRFETAESSEVRLAVYDVTGREVAVLVEGTVEAGTHAATFEARGLSNGLYVYRLQAGSRAETGRITLLR